MTNGIERVEYQKDSPEVREEHAVAARQALTEALASLDRGDLVGFLGSLFCARIVLGVTPLGKSLGLRGEETSERCGDPACRECSPS